MPHEDVIRCHPESVYDAGMKHLPAVLGLCLFTLPAVAAGPEALAVKVDRAGMLWNIHVTLRHPDRGWDHYADAWEVLDVNGNRLALRRIAHPHVEEQPFTRSLTGVVLPDGTREILVRGRCSRDGWAKEAIRVPLSP